MTKLLDYTISDDDIVYMDDNKLASYLMFTDRDRKDMQIAENLYWKIIEEINRRIDADKTTE